MTAYVLDQYYLGVTALVTVAIQLLFFVFAVIFKTDKVTDFAGGTNFFVLALVTLLMCGTYHVRQIVSSVLVMVWSIRLGGFRLFRILKSGKDDRFDEIRNNIAKFAAFWVGQMVWVWTVSLPNTLGNSPRVNDPAQGGRDVPFGNGTDIVGIIFWALGFLLEATADQQKYTFRQKRSTPIEINRFGIWRYSRHPNYMGEILLWWGIFLLNLQPSLGVGATWINSRVLWAGIASPLFTSVLLMFASGIPQSEKPSAKKQFNGNNWPAYQEYLAETSILLPFPPALYRPLPVWLKRSLGMDLPMYQFDPASQSPEESVAINKGSDNPSS
ncbi:hypothetical protein BZG36_03950 [Bifiguratus adelaidae]|uniref:Uncharacterized protein n=1 Tax=Bifiguratus adelaidae TaxID=1938954 RepID=A0A261Y057_9FUNG|nr:hypothetical protein BZG36_03950 [Bifiguratus adelaidae]